MPPETPDVLAVLRTAMLNSDSGRDGTIIFRRADADQLAALLGLTPADRETVYSNGRSFMRLDSKVETLHQITEELIKSSGKPMDLGVLLGLALSALTHLAQTNLSIAMDLRYLADDRQAAREAARREPSA